MKTALVLDLPDFLNDVPEVVRAFSPFMEIVEYSEKSLKLEYYACEKQWFFSIKPSFSDNLQISGEIDENIDTLLFKRLTKRAVKLYLYDFCSKLVDVNLPYGALTGVRPTKLFHDSEGTYDEREKLFEEIFRVSAPRAKLIRKVVETQDGVFDRDVNAADIFVNIPFCPTRCKYCSFISTELFRVKKQIPDYIATVKNELENIKKRIAEGGFLLRSIYVGGGTPTSLSAEELTDILGSLKGLGVEFTVEAGRPDSITEEKLAALEALGVTRISVNPQTLKDETLVTMGRAHTVKDFFAAYELARKHPFDINVDIIAGLPNESFEDFSATLNGVLALKPENITVHTLSLKRGAILKNEGASKVADGSVLQMTDFAREKLFAFGYLPYYMYRQKNMADNLENVGYCLPNKACLYNIGYMEETDSVFAAGAGAMSKYVFKAQNRIERSCNPKYLHEYLLKNYQEDGENDNLG